MNMNQETLEQAGLGDFMKQAKSEGKNMYMVDHSNIEPLKAEYEEAIKEAKRLCDGSVVNDCSINLFINSSTNVLRSCSCRRRFKAFRLKVQGAASVRGRWQEDGSNTGYRTTRGWNNAVLLLLLLLYCRLLTTALNTLDEKGSNGLG